MPVGERLGAEPDEHQPEVLTFGPRPALGWVRWALLLTLVALAAPLARIALWEVTKPPPDFTLVQLQGAYYGMVRSDGNNDMSTIDATKFGDPPVSIEPVACDPLYATTVANRFPDSAVDGVSTYWIGEGSASISLFTLRYPSTAAADTAFASITAALSACDGSPVAFGPKVTGGVTQILPVTRDSGVPTQTAFLLDRGVAGQFAFHVMQLSNTVSWQYRYDARNGPYQSLPAQQLMDGLAAQLLFIQSNQPHWAKPGGRPTGPR